GQFFCKYPVFIHSTVHFNPGIYTSFTGFVQAVGKTLPSCFIQLFGSCVFDMVFNDNWLWAV
ncbi:hypothetical protein, partial [Desulfobacter sp.]|uniref:hypothetical protein n=1 Tax=Desulfobacter sp. TaxID=2294 RepID=UPI003D14A974